MIASNVRSPLLPDVPIFQEGEFRAFIKSETERLAAKFRSAKIQLD